MCTEDDDLALRRGVSIGSMAAKDDISCADAGSSLLPYFLS